MATANPAEKASLLAAAISVAMNNTASGLFVAITLLLSHMFLESKTTNMIDSLEIASVKFLNSITERQHDAPVPAGSARAADPCSRGRARHDLRNGIGAQPNGAITHEVQVREHGPPQSRPLSPGA